MRGKIAGIVSLCWFVQMPRGLAWTVTRSKDPEDILFVFLVYFVVTSVCSDSGLAGQATPNGQKWAGQPRHFNICFQLFSVAS